MTPDTTLRPDPASAVLHHEDNATIVGRRASIEVVERGRRSTKGATHTVNHNSGIEHGNKVLVTARSGNQNPISSGIDATGIEGVVALGEEAAPMVNPAASDGIKMVALAAGAFALAFMLARR